MKRVLKRSPEQMARREKISELLQIFLSWEQLHSSQLLLKLLTLLYPFDPKMRVNVTAIAFINRIATLTDKI